MGEIINAFINARRASAIQEVDHALIGNSLFSIVSPVDCPNLGSCPRIWRTLLVAKGTEWTIFIGLTQNFPDEPPTIYLEEWKKLILSNPHIQNDGNLCISTDTTAMDVSDPAQLIKYFVDAAKEILEGSNANDFDTEFNHYWARSVSSDSRIILLLESIDSLSETFPVFVDDDYIYIASSLDILDNWTKNRFGKLTGIKSERLGIKAKLPNSLKPSEYPDNLDEFVKMIDGQDPSALEHVRAHILTSTKVAVALLLKSDSDGMAVAGVQFSGHSLASSNSKEITRGFRSGHVPEKILWNRASETLRKSKIVRCQACRVDHKWIHSRGGDGNDLSKFSVLLIGCGSLGSHVAHLLSRAGVGSITLTDNDQLHWNNLGRHILGADMVGEWKAPVLARAIRHELPHLNVIGIAKDWRDALSDTDIDFSNYDLVISTVADWKAEGPLNELKQLKSFPPILFGWLEPFAVAGHSLLIGGEGGCFRCGTNRFGQFLHAVAMFQQGTLKKEPGGCTHYQSYGPTSLVPVASLIVRAAIDALLYDSMHSALATWISYEQHFNSVGAKISPVWKNRTLNLGFSRTFKADWKRNQKCHVCASR